MNFKYFTIDELQGIRIHGSFYESMECAIKRSNDIREDFEQHCINYMKTPEVYFGLLLGAASIRLAQSGDHSRLYCEVNRNPDNKATLDDAIDVLKMFVSIHEKTGFADVNPEYAVGLAKQIIETNQL